MLTVVANLPYGPFNSSQFFFRKKAKLEEFLATRTADSDIWLRLRLLATFTQPPGRIKHVEEDQLLKGPW